jgi:hypothetical protein
MKSAHVVLHRVGGDSGTSALLRAGADLPASASTSVAPAVPLLVDIRYHHGNSASQLTYTTVATQ